jgi:2-keto-4-pentenoate hydratase/2-oxohepta-3-ene-1,7-dioic acid hydratase in catechol pathway
LKLVTYMVKADQLNIQVNQSEGARLGWVSGWYIIDVVFAQRWIQFEKGVSFLHDLPSDMQTLLDRGPVEMELLQEVERAICGESLASLQVEGEPVAIQWQEAQLLAPLPVPKSFRHFYTPTVYFANHHSIIGLDAPVRKSLYTKQFDFELTLACVIGKRGRNISSEQALDYIAGLMICNGWHACNMQRQEIAVRLEAAKKDDFAISMGPYLVTLDELEDHHREDHWDLAMYVKVNEKLVLQGNVKDVYCDFAQMIERASAECELVPGDVIGSGLAETKYIPASEVRRPLQPGDTVELEMECLGVLRNQIV